MVECPYAEWGQGSPMRGTWTDRLGSRMYSCPLFCCPCGKIIVIELYRIGSDGTVLGPVVCECGARSEIRLRGYRKD
jgi:hypothetical protein